MNILSRKPKIFQRKAIAHEIRLVPFFGIRIQMIELHKLPAEIYSF